LILNEIIKFIVSILDKLKLKVVLDTLKEFINAEKTTTGRVNIIMTIGTFTIGILKSGINETVIALALIFVGSGFFSDFVIHMRGRSL